jgi:guanylate kinase
MTTVFIISAPSGSGKSTLVSELMKRIPDVYFSVSYTTRPPRGQERDGHEYHFISRAEFEQRLAKDEFLESAEVFGNYYIGPSWIEPKARGRTWSSTSMCKVRDN